MEGHKPILVTGSHRSGSTWVGKILAAPSEVGYIFEPFKPTVYPGIMSPPVPHWYFYICPENEAGFQQRFSRALKFEFAGRAALRTVRSPRDFIRVLRRGLRHYILKQRGCRPLLKDPFALFSSEWLARKFNAEIVMVIRHPAAFVSSVKIKGKGFPPEIFLSQPLLLRDHLADYKKELVEFAQAEHDVVDQAALLWTCLYHAVARFRERYPNWIFVRHEDLSRDPETGFRELYRRLNIPFDKHAEAKIADLSGAHNPSERTSRGGSRRNSRANIQNWKHRLTPEEIARVRRKTESVSHLFYTEEDW